jgi:hypothetical protein
VEHEDIPNQSSSQDTVITRKELPYHSTIGIPKTAYEPELSNKAKYPMSNLISNLSTSNLAFMNQLSSVSIPNSVQEPLADPRWKEAMNEEMKSLQKNKTWEVVE